MSNLLVQNIKHTNNTTAQTIDTSGRTTAVLNNDTTYRSDNGAVTQNMVQGLAKQWMNYNHSTNSVLDSFNISSVADNTTGHFTQNYTNNMNSANYSRTAASAETGGSGPGSDRYCGPARGSSRVNTSNADFAAGDTSDQMGTLRDQGDWSTSAFGDLA
tara:strand:+ start:274 stop:750 length:477 start_codon:yes stop_codon:yes gene_type:complete